ncbi:MAG TPA: cytochrome c [Xanthobacteraceae bacterium]|nr:cytochrome c [Xanthobacteraceae bacterium]
MKIARFYLLPFALVAGFMLAGAAAAAADPSAENGKAVFVKHGCWQCHGFEGQGSVATSGGMVIANTPLPFDAFKAYVRNPAGAMPPFHAEMISDADLADIYAYLESRPKPKPAKDIPLLNNLSSK